MNPVAKLPYVGAGYLARALTKAYPGSKSKTARGFKARRKATDRIEAWAARAREPEKPLLWVHASSVGEGLQALPVIQLLRSRHANLQIIYTFFSPSAERFAPAVGANFSGYLPFDTKHDVDRALNALAPTALVFSKLDVWPLLAESAARKGVKLGMISATMPASSQRHTWLGRLALGDAYARFDAVGAISDDDAGRLVDAGVRPERIVVTGDTRYDQALARAETDTPDREEFLAPFRATRFGASRFTLVAGSTWPSDEAKLLPAWLAVRRRHPTARLIIAPHELSPEHLEAIKGWARKNGLRLSRLDNAAAPTVDVVLVERYGVLGDLYSLASVAYVGGGFHKAGLHSLVEPAAFGVPVIVGPMHRDNRDAKLLVAAGAAFRCSDSAQIEQLIETFIRDAPALAMARAAARETVEVERGAAERSVAIIERLLTTTELVESRETPD